jgi:tRNA-2-methylthio-N6-dimethylallyladenosine synthase
MNKAESAAAENLLRQRGWAPASEGEGVDLVLINTCSVRKTAETRALGRIDQWKARKRESGLTLVVSGCMAQRLGEGGLKAGGPGVDYVLGTFSKGSLGAILDSIEEGGRAVVGEEAAYVFAPSHLEPGAFRAYLPIMHGCDNFCTYCIVPYLRGREVSRPPSEILAEIREMAAAGVREVSLLGQNVNSYRHAGDGHAIDFPALLGEVDAELSRLRDQGIGRLDWVRFLSSHPRDFSERAIEAMASSPFVCRHLHLCAQHGSDRILKAMRRGYTAESYLALLDRIRAAMPGISLSTDILVGFPGETEEDLEATLELMRQASFEYAFMYYFNPRQGTEAAAMPGQLPLELRKERLARVIALQSELTRQAMTARLGLTCRVLIESASRRSAAEVLARNQQDEMVVLPGSPGEAGTFAEARLVSLSGNTFRAERIR